MIELLTDYVYEYDTGQRQSYRQVFAVEKVVAEYLINAAQHQVV